MEKTITTKEAVALLNVLNAFPCEFLDSAVFVQNYTTFRIAVRGVLKKYHDAVRANRETAEELIKPFREQAQPVMLAKAELDAKGELTDKEKASLQEIKGRLDAIGILANNATKEVDAELQKINKEHENKKLLLTCNEEDYGKIKAKIADKAPSLFISKLDGKSFDADEYEVIFNIFK